MDEEECPDFLLRAKKLVVEGKRHFVIRKGRNYRQDLFDLGLGGDMNKTWQVICQLQDGDMTSKPQLDNNGTGELVHFYQKDMPNGTTAYIKLKIDDRRGCVCISFHPVEYGEKAIKKVKR